MSRLKQMARAFAEGIFRSQIGKTNINNIGLERCAGFLKSYLGYGYGYYSYE
jgi:hypothetical protein